MHVKYYKQAHFQQATDPHVMFSLMMHVYIVCYKYWIYQFEKGYSHVAHNKHWCKLKLFA